LGFCFAEPTLSLKIDEALGPWAVNHPARWIGERALRDMTWQQTARQSLATASSNLQQALRHLMSQHRPDYANVKATDLFVTLSLGHKVAESLYTHLASQGVLIRWYADEGLVRIGVDAAYTHQQRLINSIANWKP
jgi:cobalamin biosynthetic protein CobC